MVHPDGVSFALACRVQTLVGLRKGHAHLQPLDDALYKKLAVWCGAGFLSLREITLDSPGRTLDWVARKEVVHPTDALSTFRLRFTNHTRCYGLFRDP